MVHEQRHTARSHLQLPPGMPSSIRDDDRDMAGHQQEPVSGCRNFARLSRPWCPVAYRKEQLLLSKLQKFRFYRAKIFSYQDRLEYKRSPELVYLLRTVLTVFQRAETPIHVEAWAGFEAFVTAVRAVDYKPGYVATVASPRVGKRDMMERSWRQLGALESWSLCLDDVTYWGAGNPYLRGPTCGELLHGLVDLIATVTDTVTDLTIRRSHRSHVYCRSCPLDSMFTTYFGSHVFPNLKLLIIQNINLKIEAVLSAFLKKHSSTLK